ncbi:MAG: hypothetical protein E6R03_16860 [Hyphomicrobiaceae bacterium]|nr:MAG: hypothetical protein E6R03_16860 [Hyphomicrobiaceae bacterium]
MKCYIIRKNANFKATVALIGNDLSITIHPRAEGEQERTRVVNLDALRSRPDFGDHALFTIYDQVCTNSAGVNPNVFENVSNLYAATIATKMDPGAYHRSVVQLFPMAAIYVPLADSPVSDWAIAVNCGPEDDEFNEITLGDGLERLDGVSIPTTGELLVFPVVKFSGSSAVIAPNGDVQVDFHLEAADGSVITSTEADVYLDTTGGYLTKKRIRTSGGQGSVVFRAEGLQSGDVVKIKCGFKHFSGTDDFMVTVE